MGLRKYNGKFFETLYDVEKQLYFWYEIIEKKRVTPTKKDLELLNYKFNNQCLKYAEDGEGFGSGRSENEDPYDWQAYSYFDMDGKNPEEEHPEIYDWAKDPNFDKEKPEEPEEPEQGPGTIKRAIFTHGKIVALVIIAGVCFARLSDSVIHTDYLHKMSSFLNGKSVSEEGKYDEVEKQEYSFNIINDALNRNENLSSAEKIFFSKFRPYFDEIGQYMDVSVIADRLANLKVIYTPEKCKSPDIAGEYDTVENTITIYSTDSFENCDYAVLAHEFLHVSQKSFSKRFTMELSNELATREMLRRLVDEGILKEEEFQNEYDVPVYGVGYDQCMKVYYLIANLLDEETIKKYQAVPSEIVLTNALVEIERNASGELTRAGSRYEMEKNALELLDYIDELRAEPDQYGYRAMKYTDDKYKKVCELLDYYYQVKFGKKIDECFVESINGFDKTHGSISNTTAQGRAIWSVMGKALEESVENLDEKYRIPMGEYRFVLPRTYYSNEHQNPIVYFNTYEKISQFAVNGFFVGIEITPEMDQSYQEQYEIAVEEIEQESTKGDSNETTDNVGGMGSRDIERD